MGDSGVGNGIEGHFYRRALEGKTGDGGCLHASTQRAPHRACARCRGAGAGEVGSGRRQRVGDAELCGLSLAPIQDGEVVRCRAKEAT
jgi:hypothetical protein